MDLLSLQNVNQLELFLEGNNQLILLSLQLFVLCKAQCSAADGKLVTTSDLSGQAHLLQLVCTKQQKL